MIPCFVTNEGVIVTTEKTPRQAPEVGTEYTPMEELLREAAKEAEKASTPKKHKFRQGWLTTPSRCEGIPHGASG